MPLALLADEAAAIVTSIYRLCYVQASSRFWERGDSSEDDDDDAQSATSSGSSDSSTTSSSESDAGIGNSKCASTFQTLFPHLRFDALHCDISAAAAAAVPLTQPIFQLTSHSWLGVCRFLVGSDSSEDDDDKRVVRSAKDRRGEELKLICDEIRVRSIFCLLPKCSCFPA